MFWDRRKKDRRKGKETPEAERRIASDKSDRRRWSCGILYKTSIPVTEIEHWLETNAEGQWNVALDGIEEGLSAKVLKIMFEDQEDKLAFIEAFSGRQR